MGLYIMNKVIHILKYFLFFCAILLSIMLFNWGSLPKAQDDPQTINQAIDQAISAHESDPTAHLGVGESLEQHKTNEVIDHPALSIVTDKVKAGQLLLEHFSQSRMFQVIPLPNLVLSSAGVNSFMNVVYGEVATGTTTNTWYFAYSGNDDLFGLIGSYQMSPRFRMRLILPNIASSEAYFGLGSFPDDSALGFKITGGNLKAVWWDSYPTEHLVDIAGIDLSEAHNYEVYMKYMEYVKWYVDGVEVLSKTWAQLTPDIVCVGGPTIWIRKTTSSPRVIAVYQIFLEQDYF